MHLHFFYLDTRTTSDSDLKDLIHEDSIEHLVEEVTISTTSSRKANRDGTSSKHDVVSCICQLNEENGLMIQVK